MLPLQAVIEAMPEATNRAPKNELTSERFIANRLSDRGARGLARQEPRQ
jgi:hypothetical protein